MNLLVAIDDDVSSEFGAHLAMSVGDDVAKCCALLS